MTDELIHGGPGSGRYPKGSGKIENQQWYRKLSSSRKARKAVEKKAKEAAVRKANRKTSISAQTQLNEGRSNVSSNYTDDELRAKIARLKLENDYRKELATLNSYIQKKGKNFWQDIAKKITKDTIEDVGTQVAKYMLGEGINAATGKKIYKRKDSGGGQNQQQNQKKPNSK